MGKRDKERLQRINLGLENPISGKPRFCLLCHKQVKVLDCRQHIHDCWGIELGPDDPIPPVPPREAVINYLERQKQKEEDVKV
jgi:hypothetical protein